MRKLLKQARSKLQAKQIPIAWNSLDPPSSFHKGDARSRERRYSTTGRKNRSFSPQNAKSAIQTKQLIQKSVEKVEDPQDAHKERCTRLSPEMLFLDREEGLKVSLEAAINNKESATKRCYEDESYTVISVIGAAHSGKTRACTEIANNIRKSAQFQNTWVVDVYVDVKNFASSEPGSVAKKISQRLATHTHYGKRFSTEMNDKQFCIQNVLLAFEACVDTATLMIISLDNLNCVQEELMTILQFLSQRKTPLLGVLPVITGQSDILGGHTKCRIRKFPLPLLRSTSVDRIALEFGVENRFTKSKNMQLLWRFCGLLPGILEIILLEVRSNPENILKYQLVPGIISTIDALGWNSPYTPNDKHLLDACLIGLGPNSALSAFLEDWKSQGKAYVDMDKHHITILFPVFKRLLDQFYPRLNACFPSQADDFTWNNFELLDSYRIAVRITAGVTTMEELFNGAMMHHEIAAVQFQSPPIVEQGGQMKLRSDTMYIVGSAKTATFVTNDNVDLNAVLKAPLNHTLTDTRVFLRSNLGVLMVLIQYRLGNTKQAEKIEDWLEMMSGVTKAIKQYGYTPVLVYITSGKLNKAKELVHKNTNLIIVEGWENVYFSPIMTPYLMPADNDYCEPTVDIQNLLQSASTGDLHSFTKQQLKTALATTPAKWTSKATKKELVALLKEHIPTLASPKQPTEFQKTNAENNEEK